MPHIRKNSNGAISKSTGRILTSSGANPMVIKLEVGQMNEAITANVINFLPLPGLGPIVMNQMDVVVTNNIINFSPVAPDTTPISQMDTTVLANAMDFQPAPPIAGQQKFWWSMYRMPGYTGPCMDVRRSSDNTIATIGYVDVGSGVYMLDEAALLSHIGASNGTVATWYDNESSANHLISSGVPSEEPTIATAGVIIKYFGKPYMFFDAVNDHLLLTTSVVPIQPSSVYSVFKKISAGVHNAVLGGFSNTNGTNSVYTNLNNGQNGRMYCCAKATAGFLESGPAYNFWDNPNIAASVYPAADNSITRYYVKAADTGVTTPVGSNGGGSNSDPYQSLGKIKFGSTQFLGGYYGHLSLQNGYNDGFNIVSTSQTLQSVFAIT